MSTNATCFYNHSEEQSPPLFQNGKIVFQTHHIGWIITGVFAFLATAISFWLVNKHLSHYTNRHEQRYIVRILFMVPIYSLVSFASFLFWNQSTPLLLIRDCYESTVLTSFFYLLLLYLSSDPDEQRAVFLKVGLSKENDGLAIQRGEPVQKWIFPLGSVTSKPSDGLYFLQMMKWGILQYCVIRPATTLAAVVLNYVGLYCEDSWSPGWGHITVIVSVSVSIAMYCLIQVYVPITKRLAPHRPLLKLFSVKAVVFLTFWQATFLSVLSTAGVVKDTKYMTADDINVGIGAILETIEMTIFAVLHIWAFSYKPYVRSLGPPERHSIKTGSLSRERLQGNTPRLPSLIHAFDFRETLRELWQGCIYVVQKWRGLETDATARRCVMREDLFDRGRETVHPARVTRAKPGRSWNKYGFPGVIDEHEGDRNYQSCLPLAIMVDVEKETYADVERQWFGPGVEDGFSYELGFPKRQRKAGFAEQIEVELKQRGLTAQFDLTTADERYAKYNRRQRSWWRSAYDRISSNSMDEGRNRRSTADEMSSARQGTSNHVQKLSDSERKYDTFPIVVTEKELDEPAPDFCDYRLRDVPESSSQVPGIGFIPASSSSSYPEIEIVSAKTLIDADPGHSELHANHGEAATRQDAVLSRLFAAQPVSGASVPSSSSLTHLSSHGHHVRLMTPAAVVPADKPRASECRPKLTTVDAFARNGNVESRPNSSKQVILSSSSFGSQPEQRVARAGAAQNDLTSRKSGHRREHAYYQQL